MLVRSVLLKHQRCCNRSEALLLRADLRCPGRSAAVLLSTWKTARSSPCLVQTHPNYKHSARAMTKFRPSRRSAQWSQSKSPRLGTRTIKWMTSRTCNELTLWQPSSSLPCPRLQSRRPSKRKSRRERPSSQISKRTPLLVSYMNQASLYAMSRSRTTKRTCKAAHPRSTSASTRAAM